MDKEDELRPFFQTQLDEIYNDPELKDRLEKSSLMQPRLFDEKTYEFLFLMEKK